MSFYYRQLQLMGTRLDLELPEMDPDQGDRIVGLIEYEVHRIEEKLSACNPVSVISEINRNAFRHRIRLDAEMVRIFNEIRTYHILTKGYFDIAIRPVLDFLKTKGGEHVVFPDWLKGITGMNRILMERDSVRFKKEGVAVDLGGYQKGYAIRSVTRLLEHSHVKKALLNFGERIVCGIGSHPYGDAWRVSVPGSDMEEEGVKVFDLRNECISVSGNFLNSHKKFGSSGHIFDPVHFRIQSLPGMVVVKTDDPVKSEILSTALFSAGKEHEQEIVSSIKNSETWWME